MKTFKIHVINFKKHNPNQRPSFKKVLVTVNFFNDSKISQLTTTEKLLMIFLITQAGDQGSDHIALSERQVSYAIGPGQRPESLLRSLESFQLVTLEIFESSKNRIELNRIERKREKGSEPQQAPLALVDPSPPKVKGEALLELWAAERGPFSEVKVFNEKRKRTAGAQLTKYPDLAHWSELLNRWKASDFCLTKWVPTFDDWLTESKRVATLTGRYDNRKEDPQKKHDWIENAQRVRFACSKISAYDSNAFEQWKELCGEELYRIACKIPGGIAGVRSMRVDDFADRKLAGLLKQQYEYMKNKGEVQ